MPTRRQLHQIWEAQSENYGGPGQPKQHYVGSNAAGGFTLDKQNETPIVPLAPFATNSGEIVGKAAYDKVRDDFKIVPNN